VLLYHVYPMLDQWFAFYHRRTNIIHNDYYRAFKVNKYDRNWRNWPIL